MYNDRTPKSIFKTKKRMKKRRTILRKMAKNSKPEELDSLDISGILEDDEQRQFLRPAK